MNTKSLLIKHSFFWPVLIFFTTFIFGFVNLFNFPRFLNIEGENLGQAWWLINFHKLGPYTYWYRQFPLGALILGWWQKITFGPLSFGWAINSGRILMILLASFTNVLIYKIVQNITKSRKTALISAIFFALGATNIYLHRLVVLENIGFFWFSLSLALLFASQKRGLYFLASGIAFGLACLSHISYLVFLPVLFFLMRRLSKGEVQTYSRLLWLVSLGFLMFLYPLLALLKGELLPAGLNSAKDHVSLMNTIYNQYRTYSLVTTQDKVSHFLALGQELLRFDLVFWGLGLWSLGVNLLALKKEKNVLFFEILALSYLIYLFWLGEVQLSSALIPMLGILSISTGLAGKTLMANFKNLKKISWSFFPSMGLLAVLLCYTSTFLFNTNATINQKQAIDYIQDNIAKDKLMVMDAANYLDLVVKKKSENNVFTNIEWYYQVENDLAIKEKKLLNRWEKIDYLLVNSDMMAEVDRGKLPFIKEALANAVVIKEFPSSQKEWGTTNITLYQIKKTDNESNFYWLLR